MLDNHLYEWGCLRVTNCLQIHCQPSSLPVQQVRQKCVTHFTTEEAQGRRVAGWGTGLLGVTSSPGTSLSLCSAPCSVTSRLSLHVAPPVLPAFLCCPLWGLLVSIPEQYRVMMPLLRLLFGRRYRCLVGTLHASWTHTTSPFSPKEGSRHGVLSAVITLALCHWPRRASAWVLVTELGAYYWKDISYYNWGCKHWGEN